MSVFQDRVHKLVLIHQPRVSLIKFVPNKPGTYAA